MNRRVRAILPSDDRRAQESTGVAGRDTVSAMEAPLALGAELPGASLETVFAPVRSQTAFEETLERLGTAIKLGLLPPGARLPAERELCARLSISRSTLRQALTSLVQSGHLHATRGRFGGTFVAPAPPVATAPTPALLAGWREACDRRLSVELGAAVLAADRAGERALAALDELVAVMDASLEDFAHLPPGRRPLARRASPSRRAAAGSWPR